MLISNFKLNLLLERFHCQCAWIDYKVFNEQDFCTVYWKVFYHHLAEIFHPCLSQKDFFNVYGVLPLQLFRALLSVSSGELEMVVPP